MRLIPTSPWMVAHLWPTEPPPSALEPVPSGSRPVGCQPLWHIWLVCSRIVRLQDLRAGFPFWIFFMTFRAKFGGAECAIG